MLCRSRALPGDQARALRGGCGVVWCGVVGSIGNSYLYDAETKSKGGLQSKLRERVRARAA